VLLRPASARAAACPRPGGALRPAEVADAGVFAALAVVVVSVGAFLPHLGVLELLSVVPFAIVGLRNRVRAVVGAAVAAGFVGFLVAGLAAAIAITACAVGGGLCGIIRRRGRGAGTVALVAAGLAPLAAAAAVGTLTLFSKARGLAFGSLRASVAGGVRAAESLGVPTSAGHAVTGATGALLGAWQVAVAAIVIVAVLAAMLVTNVLVAAVARRVEWLTHHDPLDQAVRADAALDEPVAPVPAELVGAGFGYPAARRDALADIDLTVAPGEFVAVVGPNGAGKSTLVSLLAGAQPARGQVRRPGRVGLGLPGGTAVVGQRAETQVIGSTVGEDLCWGLPPGYPLDAEELLRWVGLAGLAGKSTESLSGGQLQRLAIATAMARRPALLISDESTSMLDAAGRAELLSLLAGLPARTGTAVVHVTHDPAEAARADRVVGLADGRIVSGAAAGHAPAGQPGDSAPTVTAGRDGYRPPAPGDPHAGGEPVIRVRGVGHRYDAGTPWEVTALRSVDLDVYAGEGLLITGENGSGKSTLAWVLAGLTRPTEGTVTIDGEAAVAGAAALSFQHARLQLQRPTVAEDILAAAGVSAPSAGTEAGPFVRASLHRVGLPAELAGRTIDELSGGQLRRVAIAGLLASRPRLLILDEPLAGLDRESRRGLLELLGQMRRGDGLTLVVISHDFEDMGLACTRTIEVTDGIVTAPGTVTALPAAPQPARPRRGGLVLRPLPGTSPLHRLGAVPKLLILTAVTVTALLLPGWPAIAVLAGLLAAGAAAARLPRTALPRVSWWVAAVIIAGAVVAGVGGGLVLYGQAMLLTAQFFALSLLVVWTTRVEELPAAFTSIVAPLRALRAPVDEWAHSVTFAVRTLPLLREEFRVVIAGRRLRRSPRPVGRGRELFDLVVAVVASAARRAADLGRAATQRGGLRSAGPPSSERERCRSRRRPLMLGSEEQFAAAQLPAARVARCGRRCRAPGRCHAGFRPPSARSTPS
jgi:energy-coupling factor transporter ATP-binding protein EcfA2